MRYLSFLLTALCAASVVTAQTPLGPRLGNEISRAERDYFGLFPGVGSAFESARVESHPSGAAVVVTRTGKADTTLVLDAPSAMAIGRFTETFEQAQAAFLNPHWQAASGSASRGNYLDASTPVPHVNPAETTRLSLDRQRLEGVVLFASDSLLLLHPSRPYQWDAPVATRIRPSDIRVVDIGRREQERVGTLVNVAGALAGLAVASVNFFALDGGAQALPAGVTAAVVGWVGASFLAPGPPSAGSYTSRLGDLQARAAFQARIPLDFQPVEAPSSAFARGSAPSSSLARRLSDWRRAHGWVNVSLVGGASGSYQGTGAYEEYLRNRAPATQTAQTVFASAIPEVGLDVAIRPVPYVRVGGLWMRTKNEALDLPLGAGGRVSPGALRGYAEVVVPTPRMRGVGLDLAVGVGLESVETAIEGMTFRVPPLHVVSESSRQTGRFYQGTIDLVLPQRTSLFVRLTTRALPSIDVPGAEVYSTQFPDIQLYRLAPFTATFGTYREVTWGTRFRF